MIGSGGGRVAPFMNEKCERRLLLKKLIPTFVRVFVATLRICI